MDFIKLFFLFIFITFLQQRGIIYRTGKAAMSPAERIKYSILPKEENINGSWRLYGSSAVDQSSFGPGGKPYEQAVYTQKDLFISFFPDSTYTQIWDSTDYSTGRWAFDSTTRSIFLTSKRNTQEIGVRLNLAQGGMRVMNFEYSPSESMLMLEYGAPIYRYHEDPFYGANNQWREKPARPETRPQILARLRNYVLHNAYLLKAAGAREHKIVSWEFSQGIIRMYNPGIGIVKEDKIPKSWAESFYSPEQAQAAYLMFEKQLYKSKIKNEKSKNWVEANEKILFQLHKELAFINEKAAK